LLQLGKSLLFVFFEISIKKTKLLKINFNYFSTSHRSLKKSRTERPFFGELLEHPWILKNKDEVVDMAGWVASAVPKKNDDQGP